MDVGFVYNRGPVQFNLLAGTGQAHQEQSLLSCSRMTCWADKRLAAFRFQVFTSGLLFCTAR